MIKLSRILSLTLPILFVMYACSPKEELPDKPSTPTDVKVTGVSLSQVSVSLSIDETFKLDAILSPANATDKSVTWSSSDPSVVAVSNGMIKGLKIGTATITVTTIDGGYTAVCLVTVKAAPEPDPEPEPEPEEDPNSTLAKPDNFNSGDSPF